jgi:hypothetical protein
LQRSQEMELMRIPLIWITVVLGAATLGLLLWIDQSSDELSVGGVGALELSDRSTATLLGDNTSSASDSLDGVAQQAQRVAADSVVETRIDPVRLATLIAEMRDRSRWLQLGSSDGIRASQTDLVSVAYLIRSGDYTLAECRAALTLVDPADIVCAALVVGSAFSEGWNDDGTAWLASLHKSSSSAGGEGGSDSSEYRLASACVIGLSLRSEDAALEQMFNEQFSHLPAHIDPGWEVHRLEQILAGIESPSDDIIMLLQQHASRLQGSAIEFGVKRLMARSGDVGYLQALLNEARGGIAASRAALASMQVEPNSAATATLAMFAGGMSRGDADIELSAAAWRALIASADSSSINALESLLASRDEWERTNAHEALASLERCTKVGKLLESHRALERNGRHDSTKAVLEASWSVVDRMDREVMPFRERSTLLASLEGSLPHLLDNGLPLQIALETLARHGGPEQLQVVRDNVWRADSQLAIERWLEVKR